MDRGLDERAGGSVARWLLVISIAGILLATLMPAPGRATRPVSWCLVCGEDGTADAVANVLLFLPFGVAWALSGWRPSAAVIAAALLSATVETVQLALPGRDPSLGDLVCNTAGALLGVNSVAVVRRLQRTSLPAWTPLLGATGLLLAVLATALLLRPLPPPGDYHGTWTVGPEHDDAYDGRVLAVRLDGMSLPDGRLLNTSTVAALLSTGAPLEVHAIAGPPPKQLAPLYDIYTGGDEEVMLLGFDGTDIVYRLRRVSQALHLDAPELRVRGGATSIAPRSAMTLRVWTAQGKYCISLNAQARCGLGWTPGRLWAVVFYSARVDGAVGWLLDAFSIGLIALPVGLTLRRNAWSVVAVALTLGALFLLPTYIGLIRITALESAAAVLALVGPPLARRYRRRSNNLESPIETLPDVTS